MARTTYPLTSIASLLPSSSDNQPARTAISTLTDRGTSRFDRVQTARVKVRGSATLEDTGGSLRIRIRPTTIWSWGINQGTPARFAGVEKRDIPSD